MVKIPSKCVLWSHIHPGKSTWERENHPFAKKNHMNQTFQTSKFKIQNVDCPGCITTPVGTLRIPRFFCARQIFQIGFLVSGRWRIEKRRRVVGGWTNPFEKIASNWIISQFFWDEHKKKSLKPPSCLPTYALQKWSWWVEMCNV